MKYIIKYDKNNHQKILKILNISTENIGLISFRVNIYQTIKNVAT